jgi:transposase
MKRSFGQEISGNRGRGGELTPAARSSIISKYEAGCTYREIMEEYGVSRGCVHNTIQRWKTHHTTHSLPRSGRPHAIDIHESRLLFRQVRKTPKIRYNRLMEEAHLMDRAHPPSKRTVYRALKKQGLTNHRCKKRPKLLEEHAQIRRQFARTYRHFNWKRRTVKFSDECSVEVNSGGDGEWCFRYPEERWRQEMIQEKEKSKRPSQMVWGAIWVTRNGRVGRSELVIMPRDPQSKRGGYSANSYMETLQKGLLPNYLPGQIFMQDNAPIHNAQVTQIFLEEHGIWTLEWPPYSPDLNPIEHLWWALKKIVHKLHPEFEKLGNSEEEWDQFCAALKEGWRKIPNSLIRTLIWSMPRRVEAVRLAHGWQTRY